MTYVWSLLEIVISIALLFAGAEVFVAGSVALRSSSVSPNW
jgi:hypothetical protein